jgi:hypothetical protein
MGYEVQIGDGLGRLHRHRLPGRTGIDPAASLTTEPGRWHLVEVAVLGGRIEIRIDGRQTIDHLEMEKAPERGRIALQAFGEGARVRFRNIAIQESPR